MTRREHLIKQFKRNHNYYLDLFRNTYYGNEPDPDNVAELERVRSINDAIVAELAGSSTTWVSVAAQQTQPPAAESEPEPGKEEIDTDEPDADPPAGICPVCGFVILDEPEPPADWRWWRCQACGYYGPRSEFVGNTDAPQPPAAGQGGG